MAEKENAPPQEVSGVGGQKHKLLMPSILASAMLLEGLTIFGAMKLFGADPVPASAVEGIAGLEEEANKSVEIDIASFKALNEKSGLTFMVDISVSAKVPADRLAETEAALEENGKTVVDRLTQAVRSADAKYLKEEDLATLRRKMKFELDKILGDETIVEELLITRFQKFRADL
jgi:flagellar basal body-associated protein FliL